MKPEYQNAKWGNGIPANWLKNEYIGLLCIVKTCITCDGHFDHMYRYQVWFLMHLVGDIKVNIPHFLLQSLTNMARKIQKYPKIAQSSLIHQSLITMLVAKALAGGDICFSEFLTFSGFSLEENTKKKKQKLGESSKEDKSVKDQQNMEGSDSSKGNDIKVKKPEIKTTYVRKSLRSQDTEIPTGELGNEPFIRVRQTRAANKFHLKMKVLLDPKLKVDEVIVLDEEAEMLVGSKEISESPAQRTLSTSKKSIKKKILAQRAQRMLAMFEEEDDKLKLQENKTQVVHEGVIDMNRLAKELIDVVETVITPQPADEANKSRSSKRIKTVK